MKLIDADALKEALHNFFDGKVIDEPTYILRDVFCYIDNAPTVERPQGEWVESHIFSCGNILRMRINVIEHKCKNCGRWSIKWVSTIPDNFCSNCGAYMRGDDNEQ